MKRILRLCKGIVRIKITGYSPERFMNLCRTNDIELYNISVSGTGYEMETSVQNFFQLKKLLRKTGTKLKIIKKYGVPFVLFRYKKHKFFPIGMLLCMVLLIVMSQMLWEIEITGNYEITDEQFLRYLNSQHIYTGMNITRLDCEYLEEQIRNDYPDVAWVSARIDGTRLIVDVQELKKDTVNDTSQMKKGTDLIASHDGIIKSIITRSGTPLVGTKTEVKMGDVIVTGSNELYDDYGNVIGYEYCSADADVIIESTIPYEDTIALEYTKNTVTGKSVGALTFYFPNKMLKVGIFHNPYEFSQTSTKEIALKIGDRIELPIKVNVIKIEEITKEKSIYSEEQIEEIAKNNFSLYTKKMEKKGFHIVDKNGKIKVNDNQVLVSGWIMFEYLETERKSTPLKTLEVEEGIEQDGIDTDSNGDSS